MSLLQEGALLLVAALLTGVIGLEREMSHHGAGLRTHMAVGLGAALFTVVGGELGDSRMAAQVVTGIGFLGAGAILRNADGVRGLTTAAGLWAAAAVGVTVGVDRIDLAVTATVVLLAVLLLLRPIEARLHEGRPTVPGDSPGDRT